MSMELNSKFHNTPRTGKEVKITTSESYLLSRLTYWSRCIEEKFYVYRTSKQLSDETLIPQSTVKRSIKSLQDKGIIRKSNQNLVKGVYVGHQPVVFEICLESFFGSSGEEGTAQSNENVASEENQQTSLESIDDAGDSIPETELPPHDRVATLENYAKKRNITISRNDIESHYLNFILYHSASGKTFVDNGAAWLKWALEDVDKTYKGKNGGLGVFSSPEPHIEKGSNVIGINSNKYRVRQRI